jgi:hypothetical protein
MIHANNAWLPQIKSSLDFFKANGIRKTLHPLSWPDLSGLLFFSFRQFKQNAKRINLHYSQWLSFRSWRDSRSYWTINLNPSLSRINANLWVCLPTRRASIRWSKELVEDAFMCLEWMLRWEWLSGTPKITWFYGCNFGQTTLKKFLWESNEWFF